MAPRGRPQPAPGSAGPWDFSSPLPGAGFQPGSGSGGEGHGSARASPVPIAPILRRPLPVGAPSFWPPLFLQGERHQGAAGSPAPHGTPRCGQGEGGSHAVAPLGSAGVNPRGRAHSACQGRAVGPCARARHRGHNRQRERERARAASTGPWHRLLLGTAQGRRRIRTWKRCQRPAPAGQGGCRDPGRGAAWGTPHVPAPSRSLTLCSCREAVRKRDAAGSLAGRSPAPGCQNAAGVGAPHPVPCGAGSPLPAPLCPMGPRRSWALSGGSLALPVPSVRDLCPEGPAGLSAALNGALCPCSQRGNRPLLPRRVPHGIAAGTPVPCPAQGEAMGGQRDGCVPCRAARCRGAVSLSAAGTHEPRALPCSGAAGGA